MTAAPAITPQADYVVLGPEFGYLPDTKVPRFIFNYIFNDEGMGGYINYTAVTTWLARKCPFIEGRVWCEQFLVPLLKDIHAPYPNWQVLPSNQRVQLAGQHRGPTIGPLLAHNGVAAKREYTTAIGTHPIDVGSGYYMSTGRAPDDMLLPVLDYPLEMVTKKKCGDYDLQLKFKSLAPKKYVVFTAGGTVPIRTMNGEHLNPLIDFVIEKGLTPVFLGKKDILADGKATTKWIDDCAYDKGIDFRDQTTVKEAAAIMQHAACTVGLDGGLLHLACIMKDSRVVFGYNITSVEHRRPRRNHGLDIAVYLTDDELACSGCQSKWKDMFGHSYDKCFYEEGRAGYDPSKPERARACLKLLFANKSLKFKNAIEEALK